MPQCLAHSGTAPLLQVVMARGHVVPGTCRNAYESLAKWIRSVVSQLACPISGLSSFPGIASPKEQPRDHAIDHAPQNPARIRQP